MKISLYQPLCIFQKGQRDNQEDYIWPLKGTATAGDSLFIVCDGMGGHEHGEVASSTFAKGLAEYFGSHVADGDIVTDDVLSVAIAHAYTLLDAKDDGDYKRMGTTLTLLSFHKGGVMAAHIGDSRIYHMRPGKGILYVSRDHSLVFDLYRSGEISLEEMKTSPNKNIITRAVQPGEDRRTSPDIVHITDIEPGDYFYMCSDGMLEQMENDELFDLLAGPGTDEEKINRLVDETKHNRDNHSAYLIRVSEVLHEPGDLDDGGEEERTTIYNALNMRPIDKAYETSNDNAGGNAEDISAYGNVEDNVKWDDNTSYNQPSQQSYPPTAAAPLDPMDPMAPSRRFSPRFLSLLIAVALGLLAALCTLFWTFKHDSDQPDSKSVPSAVKPSSTGIKSIDPSLDPQAAPDKQQSDVESNEVQDNHEDGSGMQSDAHQDNQVTPLDQNWKSEIFFE